MISIQLPDGSKREYSGPVTVADVAQSIGSGLAKAAIAGRIGQGDTARVVDTSFVLDRDTPLAIVTDKDPAGLEVIRHSTAHLLAYAVKLAAAGFLLAFFETSIAKMRVFRLTDFIGGALMLGLLGTLLLFVSRGL